MQETKLEETIGSLPRLQILVVDDITPIGDLASMILEQKHHVVQEAISVNHSRWKR